MVEVEKIISLTSAHRDVYWNVSQFANKAAMYALFSVSLAVLASGLYQRIRLWSHGKPAPDNFRNFAQRFAAFVNNVLLQQSVNRSKDARAFHTLMFLGFIVLLFTTTMVFIDQDLGIKIYHGEFYLLVTMLSDLFGLCFILAVVVAIHRRYLRRPDNLHSTFADAFLIGILLVMLLQGFLLEALRIHATNDPWALFSPVGYLVSRFFWALSPTATSVIHFLLWWFHTITVFVFIGTIPYTKFFHVLVSSANIFCRTLDRPKGTLAFPGDLEKILESATDDFSIGVSTINDTTWKQRLDFDSCTSCGRCQDACPAYNSGKPLSPKWLILDSRNHLLGLHANSANRLVESLDKRLLKRFLLDSINALGVGRAKNVAVQNAKRSIAVSADESIAGDVMDPNVFWSCTTCRACVEACPVAIEHVDYIIDVRRAKALMEGDLPHEAQASLKAIQARGNPFGPAENRTDWAKGLTVPILNTGDSVDILYWIGCISAYDQRKQSIARSMVQILNASGKRWGILGNRENCTGDPARRLGEENIFQEAAKKNITTLNSVKFKTLVTHCPHCFNTMKNEYSSLGTIGENPVRIIHHSEFIQELLNAGLIQVSAETAKNVTYHDPCYLGRYNDIYNEPREVLVQLGAKDLKEMRDHGSKSLCCGAGGGHYWMDLKLGERINVKRTEQALETGANIVATSCPFCMQMLEDGTKLTSSEDKLIVRDIAELVAESLDA